MSHEVDGWETLRFPIGLGKEREVIRNTMAALPDGFPEREFRKDEIEEGRKLFLRPVQREK